MNRNPYWNSGNCDGPEFPGHQHNRWLSRYTDAFTDISAPTHECRTAECLKALSLSFIFYHKCWPHTGVTPVPRGAVTKSETHSSPVSSVTAVTEYTPQRRTLKSDDQQARLQHVRLYGDDKREPSPPVPMKRSVGTVQQTHLQPYGAQLSANHFRRLLVETVKTAFNETVVNKIS